MVSRTPAIRKQIAAWIAKRTPKGYDRAVELLVDLQDAAALTKRSDEFVERLQALRGRHASKPGLIRQLEQAGLTE